jgi:hypothetical protein
MSVGGTDAPIDLRGIDNHDRIGGIGSAATRFGGRGDEGLVSGSGNSNDKLHH